MAHRWHGAFGPRFTTEGSTQTDRHDDKVYKHYYELLMILEMLMITIVAVNVVIMMFT